MLTLTLTATFINQKHPVKASASLKDALLLPACDPETYQTHCTNQSSNKQPAKQGPTVIQLNKAVHKCVQAAVLSASQC